jgi:hypothetical protein
MSQPLELHEVRGTACLFGVRAHPGSCISINRVDRSLDLFFLSPLLESSRVESGGAIQFLENQLPRTHLPRTPLNKGEMRKVLILVNSTQERSKDRRESPEKVPGLRALSSVSI